MPTFSSQKKHCCLLRLLLSQGLTGGGPRAQPDPSAGVGYRARCIFPLHEFTKSKTAAGVYTPGSSRVPLLLPVLLLDTEPSLDSRRVAPPAGGTGDGGGRGPPRSLTALAALLRETLTGEMPSAQSVSVLDVH